MLDESDSEISGVNRLEQRKNGGNDDRFKTVSRKRKKVAVAVSIDLQV